MHSVAGKPLARFPEAKIKVRRAEFEDGTIKSLVREGTRLGHQLKQYDRARKVMRKELEYDQRQAAKLSRNIRPSELFHMLSLHGDSSSDANTIRARTNQRSHRDAMSTSPRSPSINRRSGYRAKTANASLRVHEDTTVQNGHSGACQQRVGRKHQFTNKTHEDHLPDSPECSGHESVKRNIGRKKLFDDLSKPKNRSDILGVRQRLREEFGKQRPYSSHAAAGSNPSSPRVVIHGSGPNAVAMLTTRSPVRRQTLSIKDKGGVDEVDGDQQMSAADLKVLLTSPSPVVVKRDPDER